MKLIFFIFILVISKIRALPVAVNVKVSRISSRFLIMTQPFVYADVTLPSGEPILSFSASLWEEAVVGENNCVYRGTGIDYTGFNSQVVMTNCRNIFSALIHNENDLMYYIQYSERTGEYLYYNSTDETIFLQNYSCGSDSLITNGVPTNKTSFRNLQSNQKAALTLTVNLIYDSYRSASFASEDTLQASNIAVAAQLKYIYTLFASPDYELSVAIRQITPMDNPTWKPGDDSGTILQEFGNWATTQTWNSAEPTALLTGLSLEGTVIGLGYLGTACSPYLPFSVTTAPSTVYDAVIAKTVAHEIGHNIGLYHTTTTDVVTNSDACASNYNAVMSPVLISTSIVWDSCSYDWFKVFMLGYPFNCDGSSCDFSPRYTDNCFTENNNLCGNGVVDDGEDCDCGADKTCKSDPCCDPSTCRFKGSCSPKSSICCTNSCQFSPRVQMCKARTDAYCDVDSYCSGVSGDCPVPVNRPNEEKPCTYTGLVGVCYNGTCVSRDRTCFSVSKAYGYDIRGSCGDSSICGDLYCKLGYLNTCSIVYAPQKLQVPDGVACGKNGTCIHGQCSLATEAPAEYETSLNPTSKKPSTAKKTKKPKKHKHKTSKPSKPSRVPSEKPTIYWEYE